MGPSLGLAYMRCENGHGWNWAKAHPSLPELRPACPICGAVSTRRGINGSIPLRLDERAKQSAFIRERSGKEPVRTWRRVGDRWQELKR